MLSLAPVRPLSAPLAAAAISAGAIAAAAAAAWWFWRAPDSAAKCLTGGTLRTHPSSYDYLMQHVGETAAEVSLRGRVLAQARAGMMGSPDEAAFLRWLAELLGARRVVEVGTFRGTTTLALARGVGAGGEVVALDVDGRWLDAGGRDAWKAAGVDGRITFVQGPAADSLAALPDASFDLVFVDADKHNYKTYYEHALRLLRKGGVVAVDNVLWHGKAERPPAGDAESAVIHVLNNLIRADARVSAFMLGIADGVYLCRKL
jgi:caffeoyl-CoA O-methyltransferase